MNAVYRCTMSKVPRFCLISVGGLQILIIGGQRGPYIWENRHETVHCCRNAGDCIAWSTWNSQGGRARQTQRLQILHPRLHAATWAGRTGIRTRICLTTRDTRLIGNRLRRIRMDIRRFFIHTGFISSRFITRGINATDRGQGGALRGINRDSNIHRSRRDACITIDFY